MTGVTEPLTEAGRRLLAELSENPLAGDRYAWDVVGRRLPAIEAEARADERRRVEAPCPWCGHPTVCHRGPEGECPR